MSAEKQNALMKCKNPVTKYWDADIHVLVQLEKNNACHVLRKIALQKCPKI
jgi:hypothetical protein